MNLKIKCETPKDQVLVLRKFKKLVPECKWRNGVSVLDHIPFIEKKTDQCSLVIHDNNCVTYCPDGETYYNEFAAFTASDFLLDDWKLEPDKSEVQAKIEALQSQLNELKELIKKEEL